jgi:hypothetical protein
MPVAILCIGEYAANPTRWLTKMPVLAGAQNGHAYAVVHPDAPAAPAEWVLQLEWSMTTI